MPKLIQDILKQFNVQEENVTLYGSYKAKIDIKNPRSRTDAKLVLVTSINPTKGGEGKTTTAIGLADALTSLGYTAIPALREPSLGPVMGMKGGGTGGGEAELYPALDINLHFTGDLHAIQSAHNLISALLDNHIYQGNSLKIDQSNILWPRTLDVNDRSLRNIVVATGGKESGRPHSSSFVITAASELMAIMALALDEHDLATRLNKIALAYDLNNKLIYLEDLQCTNAIVLLLKDALIPNFVQTKYSTLASVHCGPFANIAHGCCSIKSLLTAQSLAEYTVTEAGFGADLGFEKFIDIPARLGKLNVSCVVIVITMQALRQHASLQSSQEAHIKGVNHALHGMESGLLNLQKHLNTIQQTGLDFVICLNKFPLDTEDDLTLLQEFCKEHNYNFAVNSSFKDGPQGAEVLAKKVVELSKGHKQSTELYKQQCFYAAEDSIVEKLTKIATKVYGAKNVILSANATKQLALFNEQNFKVNDLLVCIAKTEKSLSDDPKLLGRPEDFSIHIKEFSLSLGAEFLVALAGNIFTMPGLPKVPAAMQF